MMQHFLVNICGSNSHGLPVQPFHLTFAWSRGQTCLMTTLNKNKELLKINKRLIEEPFLKAEK